MKLDKIVDLNTLIKETLTLNPNLKNVQISGEINDFSINKGHVYFKLKDESASISAVIWKNNAVNINRDLYHDGVKIDVIGSVSSWEKNASISFQIINYKISGEGDIKRIFNERLASIKEYGWDRPEHKKTIKSIPENIAIISTIDGDGLRDVVNTIRRKNNMVNIFIFPSSVQGERASNEIISAIDKVEKLSNNKIPLIETILLVRGGGSAEDLWCFNDLKLAKRIYDCEIPIITGIGHQPDETIADYVSDLRAITPTDAGNKVIKEKSQLVEHINNLNNQNNLAILAKLELHKSNLSSSINSLNSSANSIEQKISYYKNELKNTILNTKSHLNNKLLDTSNSIKQIYSNFINLKEIFNSRINNYRNLISNISETIVTKIINYMKSTKTEFNHIQNLFDISNPKKPLERGYVIITGSDNKKIIKSKSEILENQVYNVEFIDGIAKLKGDK